MVARMLHQLTSPDPVQQYALLRAARTHLELGGPARMRYTLPALAFCGLRALRGVAQSVNGSAGAEAEGGAASTPVTAEALLQWLLQVCLALAEVPAPLQALRLLLACGHVASEEAGLEMLAYEFFEQVRQCWQPCHCYRPLGGTRCVTNHAM